MRTNEFCVRPEIHSLIRSLDEACSRMKPARVAELMATADEWRESRTANELETAVWIGTLTSNRLAPCASDMESGLENALGAWTVYFRELRNSRP